MVIFHIGDLSGREAAGEGAIGVGQEDEGMERSSPRDAMRPQFFPSVSIHSLFFLFPIFIFSRAKPGMCVSAAMRQHRFLLEAKCLR